MKRVDITLKINNNDNLFFINLFKLKRKKNSNINTKYYKFVQKSK